MVVLIGLNVLFGVVMYVASASGTLEPDQAIRYGVYGGIVLFMAGLIVSIDRVITAQLRIFWQRGGALTGASIGALTGLGLAFGVTELSKAATHRPFIEESAALLISGGGWKRIVLAALVTAVMAPVVEELVFRGLFAQSLRKWGLPLAVGISSSTFAIAHLRFGVPQLLYFGFMGSIFCGLYFRRGLAGSVGAHAAFNGTLVALTVMTMTGPARVVVGAGASLTVPGHWWELTGRDDAMLALGGPSASRILFMGQPIPSGMVADVEVVTQNLASFGMAVTQGSVRTVDVSGRKAIRFQSTENGHVVEVIVVPGQSSVWTVVFVSGGSNRARADFERMLPTLQLSDTLPSPPIGSFSGSP